MKVQPHAHVWPAVLLLATALTVQAALTVGGNAYTKRYKTILLAEPAPSAKPAGELAFARKLKVEDIHGNWYQVSDGPALGWVFAGSLAEKLPDEGKGLDGLPMFASQTTATAAARPMAPVIEDFAARRNLNNAYQDLNWLTTQCRAFTPETVVAFLQAQKKGEYQ